MSLKNRPSKNDFGIVWAIWAENFEKNLHELWDYVKQVDKRMVPISSVSKSIHPDEWESIKGLIHKFLGES